MPFDPRRLEAELALGRISPESMPRVAWDALEAGYDGPATRRVAAFEDPTGFETDAILSAFMSETGMQLLPKSEAAMRLAYQAVREILEARKNPSRYFPYFYQLWVESEFVRDLQELGNFDDAHAWLDEKEHKVYVHDELILFARNHANPAADRSAIASS